MRTIQPLSLFFTLLLCPLLVLGEETVKTEQSPVKFYLFWKSLKPEMKEHYIKGYLQGWSDAGSVNALAINALEKDPKNPIDTLQTLTPMFDVADTSSHDLVVAIDDYLKDDSFHASSATRVIAAVRAKQASRDFKMASESEGEAEPQPTP